MSFSHDVKSEIGKIEIRSSCCLMARLLAVLCFSGVYGGKNSIKLSTENANVARFFCVCLKSFFTVIHVSHSKNFNSSNLYTITCNLLDEEVNFVNKNFLIKGNHFVPRVGSSFSSDMLQKKCCYKTFMRTAFMSTGSISSPRKTYHLEFSVKNHEVKEILKQLLHDFSFCAKEVKRRNSFVLYFKDSELIADILTFMGAHTMLLDFLDTKIIKELRNNTNRLVNCETANIQKVANAAVLQIQSIKMIKSSGSFEKLGRPLQELAELRLTNPEDSLAELGSKCSPPITKSGVKRRMDKIIKIASDLRSTDMII